MYKVVIDKNYYKHVIKIINIQVYSINKLVKSYNIK